MAKFDGSLGKLDNLGHRRRLGSEVDGIVRRVSAKKIFYHPQISQFGGHMVLKQL